MGRSIRRFVTLRIIRYIPFFPGIIPRRFDYTNPLTNQRIRIEASKRFTIINIDGMDYWFQRLTGKFDGIGYATSCKQGDIPE